MGVLSFGLSIKAGNARHRCAVGVEIVVAFTRVALSRWKRGVAVAAPTPMVARAQARKAPLEGSQDGDCRVWKKMN